MAELRVTPTRMELKKLQERYKTARRGHKLLKDKRDELMRHFLSVAREAKELRTKMEEALLVAEQGFATAAAASHPKMLATALLLPRESASLTVSSKSRMGIPLPHFQIEEKSPALFANYGYAFTSGALDTAISDCAAVLPLMVQVAELEKAASLLAEEIERTRRRVNALEHIMLPRYEAAMKTIKMKLAEDERGNITRLMKVKEMMLCDQMQKKHRFFPDEE